jgi:hypothetical protein
MSLLPRDVKLALFNFDGPEVLRLVSQCDKIGICDPLAGMVIHKLEWWPTSWNGDPLAGMVTHYMEW